jgi:hypothetical protein
VAYQANDFVNPNQRGVELPAGCKDLNEVLQKMGAQKQMAQPIFPQVRGDLGDVPRYVERVYMGQYGLSLGVVIRAAEALLWVHNHHTGPALTFLLRKQHTMLAPLVEDLFGNGGFHQEVSGEVKLIRGPLPHLWLEGAQIVEKVIRGYGAAENAELLFHFVRRAE